MEINYKLQTEKEEYKTYNNKVVKLKTTYKLKINLPYWIDGFYLSNFFSTKLKGTDNVVVNIDQGFTSGSGLNRRRNYYIYFPIYTTAKCNNDDTFDETKGVHICETKAEIKALETVKKFILKLKNIISIDKCSEFTISILDNRIDKNYGHLNILNK